MMQVSPDQLVAQCMSAVKPKQLEDLDRLFDRFEHIDVQVAFAAVQTLDPVKHTMGTIHFLDALDISVATQRDVFISAMEVIAQRMDPRHQLRYPVTLKKFRRCVLTYGRAVSNASIAAKSLAPCVRGTRMMRQLMTALAPADTLTPCHAQFVMLALKAQNPGAALPLLEQTIVAVDPAYSGVSALDVMLYYYYGGLAYTALHQWKKALDCFNDVLTVPTRGTPSCVMVDAYCARLLVGFIVTGDELPPPPSMSPNMDRLVRQACQHVESFVDALASHKSSRVQREAQQSVALLQDPTLSGLAIQAIQAMQKRAIVARTRIYEKLNISDIARDFELTPAAVETMLREMIGDGMVDAVIDPADGTVTFGRKKDTVNVAALEERIAKASAMARRIEAVDDEVRASKNYQMAQLSTDPALPMILESYEKEHRGGVLGALTGLMGRTAQ